jgi:predicted hydrocarbon binding protein
MTDQLDRLHGVAYLLGALAHASEKNLGQSSHSICMLAGKKFGREAVENVQQTDDPEKAVVLLKKALEERGIVWDFEPFKGERDELIEKRDGSEVMRLVFRTCMVRNALFRYAHEQKESLCYMAHGVFAGAMEKVMPDKKVQLEILHAGPNACLKEMILEDA